MKIYTKTGDDGTTALFGGTRVAKSSLRIESYGTTDELNSMVGLARSYQLCPRNEEIAMEIQNNLFVLGADLATPPDRRTKINRIEKSHAIQLEHFIDELEAQLDPLRFFILPGGMPGGAALHCARTICRRAERIIISAIENGEVISSDILIFLNRLSDLLFVMARYENHASGIEETKWKTQ